ncbi:TetR/AcrR family transcriptional regulator [Pseudonocardia sp. NPDC046786]|uniref:TetR/AcrR family transcriptional regulator n=1 Tax=Pseudonocardia sp. NPDC046786 TaxID=3155471 RepID=UPI003409E881
MTVEDQESPTRERTRRAILRAAIGALSCNPGAALGEIAETAGVARSTLHRYYPDRAALSAGVEAFVTAEYSDAIRRARPDDGTGLAAYTRLCAELIDGREIFAWWLRGETEEETPAESDDDRLVAGIVHRGHADGSIDRELDADWLVGHIWCGLFAAFHLPEPAGRSPRETREMCLRTLVKTAAA